MEGFASMKQPAKTFAHAAISLGEFPKTNFNSLATKNFESAAALGRYALGSTIRPNAPHIPEDTLNNQPRDSPVSRNNKPLQPRRVNAIQIS